MELAKRKTFVYIDVSNIRWACSWSCGFNIDFIKFYKYLKNKYPNVQDIRYYEGIAKNDKKKQQHFHFLKNKVGYTVCSLERKSYTEPAKYATYSCEKCQYRNKIQISSKTVKLKSNVDVYLASDMLVCAAKHAEPVHIVLVSCDGDYSEAINSVLTLNPDAFVTIMATPATRQNNCLSSRLQNFADRTSTNTALVNISSIKDYIS